MQTWKIKGQSVENLLIYYLTWVEICEPVFLVMQAVLKSSDSDACGTARPRNELISLN